MVLNHLGVERFRAPPPVTRPPIRLPELDDKAIEAEARAAAAKIKTIRLGRDAWQAIGRAQSFDAWKAIGAALAVGKAHALKVSGANAAWGRNYSREFSDWIKQHGFDKMPAATRSVAVELHENAAAIEQWRSTLSEKDRRRLVHPLSVTRRFKASLTHGNGKCPQDLRRDARAAWARFCSCLEGLPPAEARPLWQSVATQATIHIS